MAKEDELELDTGAKNKSSKARLIILIGVVMLLTTGVLVAVLYFTGSLKGMTGTRSVSKDDGHSEQTTGKELKNAFYYNMQPAFIVNFEEQSKAAYLQIEMQAMSYDKQVLDMLTKHMPVLRNNILLIMSSQKFEQVRTREGKEKLQAQILAEMQKVVGEAMQQEYKDTGVELAQNAKVPNVEQIYFTSFIMQ